MAGSVNKVILVGNLGKDPEARTMQSGGKSVSFSLATSETWNDKASGDRKEKTQWHRVVIFNERLGEVAEKYLKKGAKVYVEGALESRKFTDKDGAEREITEVVLSRFRGELTMLSGRGEESPMPGGEGGYPRPPLRTPFLNGGRASCGRAGSSPAVLWSGGGRLDQLCRSAFVGRRARRGLRDFGVNVGVNVGVGGPGFGRLLGAGVLGGGVLGDAVRPLGRGRLGRVGGDRVVGAAVGAAHQPGLSDRRGAGAGGAAVLQPGRGRDVVDPDQAPARRIRPARVGRADGGVSRTPPGRCDGPAVDTAGAGR
jgi:single-strand DNA-binding protein